MKKVICLLAALIMLFSSAAMSKDMDGKASLFVAISDHYNWGTIRVGYSNWELGMITRSGIYSLGVIRNVPLSANTYAGIGPAILIYDNSVAPAYLGLIGSIGYEYPALSWLTLRAELVGIGQWQGVGYGGAMLGLRLHTF